MKIITLDLMTNSQHQILIKTRKKYGQAVSRWMDGQSLSHAGKSICKELHTRVYPKVSGLANWSENCKWYSSLPLGAVVCLFCEPV